MSKLFDKNIAGMKKASNYAATQSKQDRPVYYKVEGDLVYLDTGRKEGYKLLFKEHLHAIFTRGVE